MAIQQVSESLIFLSPDGKYILTGSEDDLVQVWSMDDRKIVAWGEGHNSWVKTVADDAVPLIFVKTVQQWCIWYQLFIYLFQVSAVAFDSYWSAPSEDDSAENVVYCFGSVGQVLNW